MTATTYLEDVASCLSSPLASDGTGRVLELDDAMAKAVTRISGAGTVYLIGNGGSASVVAHAQNDFVKAARVKARVFQDVPLLTAYANDCGYADSQAEPLALWIARGDVLIAVSSSGASQNILRAVQVARSGGASILTYSGFEATNPLRQMGHLNFYVPSDHYGHVELTHAALLHCLTDWMATRA